MDKPNIEKVTTNIKALNFRDATARRTELLKMADEVYEAHPDGVPGGPDEIKFVDAVNKTIEELEHHISEQEEWIRLQKNHKAKLDTAGGYSGGAPPPYEGQQAESAAKGAAKIMLGNPEFKAWLDKVTSDGKGGHRPLGESDTINGTGCPPVPFDRKDLVTDAMLTTGAMVRPDYRPLVDLGWPKLTLRNLMSVGQTGSDVVTYPRVNVRANNARVVAEATATGGSSGTKPESAWGIQPVTANVQTIAHWIPVTKTALSDAGQLELLLNNFLTMGLDQAVENQLLNGAGPNASTPQLLGLTNQPYTLGQNFDTNILVTARRAKTRVEDVGNRIPNGYLLNPNDWDDFELTTAPGSGIFYYGGPAVIGPPRLWNLPVVTSHYQPRGSGYCADFTQYALWDREQANIKMTDSHMDFFIRNMVVILAELRLANGILDGNGICQMDLFAGANS